MNKWENMVLQMLDFQLATDAKEFNSYFKWLVIYNKFIEKAKKDKEEQFK